MNALDGVAIGKSRSEWMHSRGRMCHLFSGELKRRIEKAQDAGDE